VYSVDVPKGVVMHFARRISAARQGHRARVLTAPHRR
jgi:hypothetical protein